MPIPFENKLDRFFSWKTGLEKSLKAGPSTFIIEPTAMPPPTPRTFSLVEILETIDHTLLDPRAKDADYQRLVHEAFEYGFKAVCVPSAFVGQVREQIQSRPQQENTPLLCTVVNFPHGLASADSVISDTESALRSGADEIDVVLPLGDFLNSRYAHVYDLVSKLSIMAPTLKVILETAYLTDFDVVVAAKLCEFAGAHFIKTSTGFALQEPKGAQLKHIHYLRTVLLPETQLKASGGIRTLESAQQFLSLGATRLGTSSGVAMAKQIATPTSGAY